MAKTLIVIPSRLGATRLPEKPLLEILGKPMVQWVYECAKAAKIDADIVIATDHKKIFDRAISFGAQAVMTSESCQNGTERVFEAYKKLNSSYEYILNLQGDEPMMLPKIIESTLKMVMEKNFDIGSAMTDLENKDELKSPSCVKVIVDHSMKAIYFSRFPVPFSVLPPESYNALSRNNYVFRHLGLYVYKKEILEKLVSTSSSFIERAESLEQLRALYCGYSIGLAYEPGFCGISVDTQSDLEKVRLKMKENKNE